MKKSLIEVSECCGTSYTILECEDVCSNNYSCDTAHEKTMCDNCKEECYLVNAPEDHDCHLSPEDGCTHESHSRRIPVQDMNEPTTVMGAFAKVQESVDELQDILNRDPLKALKYNNFPF